MNPSLRAGRTCGAAAVVTLSLLAGCRSGPSTATKKAINTMLATQNWSGAEAYIEKNKESQYKKKNLVLFYLDKGLIQHHAGKYQESEQSLDAAETRMEELYTKSITKTGGMFFLNDNTVDYAGEPFERALTNVFRALNYVFLGKPDEALVESRKVEAFLEELNSKLEKKSVYKDDAFARYLDALLYADAGKMDDARISMQKAQEAYSWYSTDYNTPFPKFDFPEDKKKRSGELVFLHYNGVSPRKVSKTWQIAWGQAIAIAQSQQDTDQDSGKFKNALAAGVLGRAVTVAYPAYVQDPYAIVASEVIVDSATTASTVVVENISAIATKNLDDRIAIIKTRAIARATVKFVIAEAASKAAAKECDRLGGMQALACKLAARAIAHGVAAASEIADTRHWTVLPAQIRMARLKLPPGKHQVQINFKNAQGAVVQSASFQDVEIEKSKRKYLHHRTAL